LVLKWIHNRSGYTLINANKIRWNRIFWAMGVFGGIIIIFEAVNWAINPSLYEFSFNENIFFQYFIVSLLLIPFQATGEEMLMRGYFLQGFSWSTKRPWASVLITSILFGLLHLANPELKVYGYIFIFNYILMGLVAGILTILDDGAELAIGVHIINNLYSAIFVGFPSSVLETNTIFKIKNYDATFWFIVTMISFAIFLFICNKKYQWNNANSFFDKLKY
jgi:uncharacterized protein